MRTKLIGVVVTAVLISTIDCSAANNESRGVQIGLYLGTALSQEINDAHGNHMNLSGQNVDTKIDKIDVNQNMALGINARYYFNEYLGVGADAIFSTTKFPEQQVRLLNFEMTQPKSDLELYTLSLGPVIRYKGVGVWQAFNPYVSVAVSVLFGSVSDVNMTPKYGKGGSSSIGGTGFTFSLGTQYNMESFGISVEYRYETIELDIDHFRSFEEGISFTKNGSYLGGRLYF